VTHTDRGLAAARIAVLLLTIAPAPRAVLAFHDGGVAECAGCHTMQARTAPRWTP